MIAVSQLIYQRCSVIQPFIASTRRNHDVHLATEKRNALWCVLNLAVFDTELIVKISAIGEIRFEGLQDHLGMYVVRQPRVG